MDGHVYPICLTDMYQTVELSVDTIRESLTDLERCRAIKVADINTDTVGVTLMAIYTWPETWTPLQVK